MTGLPGDMAAWLDLFTHFALLSLLAVGGAIATAPDMHRYVVDHQHWLTDAQFSSSISLSQAAPGPNVLFVALIGWQIGLNAAATAGWQGMAYWLTGLAGVAVCMAAILLPSSVLTYAATRWAWRNQTRREVRAFKQGMAPVVIALLLATGWLLSSPAQGTWPLSGQKPLMEALNQFQPWLTQQPLGAWALTASVTVLVWRTKLHMLWLLGAGALLGVLGWV